MTDTTVALVGNSAAQQLYGAALRTTALQVVDGVSDTACNAAVIVQPEKHYRDLLETEMPVLVGVDVLRDLLPGEPAHANWIPILPMVGVQEFEQAIQYSQSGELGEPLFANITTLVGVPDPVDWDVEHLCATSRLEAVVWGLDFLEQVFKRAVSGTTWLHSKSEAIMLALHVFEDNLHVFHSVQPVNLAAGPLYSVTITFEKGQLLLRAPFAPSSVTLWQAEALRYLAPALPPQKPDRLARDTIPGGWELQTLFKQLLSTPLPPTTQQRQQDALRLVSHVMTSLGGRDELL